ncbi:MAG: SDR family oxidoreductase [Gammaproteobacteria bacterium]|nr:SDR family oxidoreductase [Gammaproteobacteria bacterium]
MAELRYFDLGGRVAIVTGAAAGIGRGIAEGLAEAGASVVIASRRQSDCEATARAIAERTGARTEGIGCDLRDATSIQALVDATLASFGRIDILVNNAGVIEEQFIVELDTDAWDNMLDTNLKAVFLLARAVVKVMIAQGGGGRIINVSSIAAHVAWPKMAAYCASKAGNAQLTKVMALEWARHGIRVNAILPGYFRTPMSTGFVDTDVGKKVIERDIPLRRVAEPDEVKGLAVLLASDAASFITGAEFTIDGGQSCR